MSEKEMKDAENNNAENNNTENGNIEVEPLSDQDMDSVPGGTYDGMSEICSTVWCS